MGGELVRTSEAVAISPEDGLAIQEVMTRYASAIDDKDWALFRTCWTDDCEASFSGLRYVGRQELSDGLEDMHAPLDGSLHRFSNVKITSFDGDTAQATSYVHAVMVKAAHPDGADFHMFGYYEDELVKDDGAWKIARRAFHTVWSQGNPGVLALDGGAVDELRRTEATA
jgi:ketosteroid isomerase-like protein